MFFERKGDDEWREKRDLSSFVKFFLLMLNERGVADDGHGEQHAVVLRRPSERLSDGPQ